jgi:hypothetical protein
MMISVGENFETKLLASTNSEFGFASFLFMYQSHLISTTRHQPTVVHIFNSSMTFSIGGKSKDLLLFLAQVDGAKVRIATNLLRESFDFLQL